MPTPYYQDDLVTLYHGDAMTITEWTAADVLVCDPPYGRQWRQRPIRRQDGSGRYRTDSHIGAVGIAGDEGTATRDAILKSWGDRLAILFGDLTLAPPSGTKLTLIYAKPGDAGIRGAIGGYRRDAEAIYLIGPWASGLGGVSSVIHTAAPSLSRAHGVVARHGGHPHTKPVDLMEILIGRCPPGVIADPCVGSGSTLVAARNLGRRAIGVELDERWCETAARRLSQQALDLGA